MTERVAGLLVVLDKNRRIDDAEQIQRAILCFDGVVEARFVEANVDQEIAYSRFRQEFLAKVTELVMGPDKHGEVT